MNRLSCLTRIVHSVNLFVLFSFVCQSAMRSEDVAKLDDVFGPNHDRARNHEQKKQVEL